MSGPEIWGISELAQWMGCSSEALRKRLRRHPADLPTPIKIGSRLVWHRAAVEDFFERRSRAVQRRKDLLKRE